MIGNPTQTYREVKREIIKQGLVECFSYRDSLDKLEVGHKILDSDRTNTYRYAVAHLPNPQENNAMVVFGIEYHKMSPGNQSPFIVVQYESGNGVPLMIAYLDLNGDLYRNVAVSESAEDSLKSLESIMGKGLEEGVQILFEGIKESNAA